MRTLAWIIALTTGFTGGGALHLWLLSDAVVDRLHQARIDTYGWSVKPPGETLGGYLVLYLLACSAPFIAGLLLASSALTERWKDGGVLNLRWQFADLLLLGAWGLLGVALAAGLNLLVVAHDYREAATSGVYVAATTIAVGLPAIRDFTGRYLLVVTVLFALTSLAGRLARRRTPPERGVRLALEEGR